MRIRLMPLAIMSSAGGRTLIETLVTTLILSIVVGLTASLFAAGTRTFSRETTSVMLHGDLAAAKNVVLDDLSIAGFHPEAVCVTPCVTFASVSPATAPHDRMIFLGDVDSDQWAERITYEIVGNELRRTVEKWDQAGSTWLPGIPQVLATNVTSLELTFLDESRSSPPLTKAEVEAGSARYAQIAIEVAADAKGGTITKTISGEVAIRN